MNQVSLPVDVSPEEVARKRTLGDSIGLCAELAGFSLDKQLAAELKVDKAQFSRWLTGQEGVVWPKLVRMMDVCGNDAPLLWMLAQRGYDLHSLRKRETETERQNRELREEVAALRRALGVPQGSGR